MIHFIFTTVALHILTAVNLSPYFERSGVYEVSSAMSLAVFHRKQDSWPLAHAHQSPPTIQQSLLQLEGVDLACSMFVSSAVNKPYQSSLAAENELSRLLLDYIHHRQVTQTPSTWLANRSRHSCTLHDHEHQLLFLFGDTVGALPLWYEIQDESNGLPPQIYVSSHLLAASSMGFNNLTPVGPGLTVTIAMSPTSTATGVPSTSFEVLTCQHWSEGRHKPYETMRIDEADRMSKELLEDTSISLSALIDEVTVGGDGILTELDMHDDSSVLLECALHRATQNTLLHTSSGIGMDRRLRFRTQPLITDHTSKPDVFNGDLQDQIQAFYEGYRKDTLAWKPGVMRMAVARAKLCQHAHLSNRTLLSYDTGLSSTSERSLSIYFQNLFCSLLNVPILYPFLGMRSVERLYEMPWKKSYLRMTADNYIADGLCGENMPTDRVNVAEIAPQESVTPGYLLIAMTPSQPPHHSPPPSSPQQKHQHEQRTDDKEILVLKTKKPLLSNPSHHSTSFIQRVVLEAKHHAFGQHQELFLVLVTSSYLEIFMNFVCHVKGLSDLPNTGMFLVLTPHEDVVAVAKGAGFGSILLDFKHDPSLKTVFKNMSNLHSQTGADFGTISYQRMMYVRTYTALVLLQAKINPVIVDIDTVWLQYPLGLALLNKNGDVLTNFDVVVTFDQEEICGCFVYLNSTTETITFWSAVVDKHLALLEENLENTRNHSGHMSNFFDSEQKILTDFLLYKKYQPESDELRVFTHPRQYFLNGLDFFLSDFDLLNQQFMETGLPAVIHNNFIIGHSMKKNRFQRFGLWRVDTWDLFNSMQFRLLMKENNTSLENWVMEYARREQEQWLPYSLYCSKASQSPLSSLSSSKPSPLFGVVSVVTGQIENSIGGSNDVLRRWTDHGMFHQASHNTAQRTLGIILPLHNEIEHNSQFLKVMVMLEGEGAVTGKFFTTRNPPSYIEFDNSFFVAELSYDFAFTTFTVEFKSVGFVAYVDVVGGNNVAKSISIDRSYKYQKEADGRVRNSQAWVQEWDTQQSTASSAAENQVNDTTDDALYSVKSSRGDVEFADPTSSTAFSSSLSYGLPIIHTTSRQFSFLLRVLTYNRPESLQRLLNSLAAADYGFDNNIALCILVDFPSEEASVEDHHGLKLQWLDAFQPPSHPISRKTVKSDKDAGETALLDENVIGIILEDDLEVSPFFFLWTLNAVIKYYIPKQVHLHKELLAAIRQHIAQDPQELMQCLLKPLEKKNTTHCSAVDKFVQHFGGMPLQYGICLAKQREDFFHYPHELEVRNGYEPFLYSPIGTWGTVLYPIIWEAFREWWLWREQFRVEATAATFPPYVDFDLLTNHYFTQNPSIWSPWHIRFAYETGAKCLYPNLPGQYSLVSNYREKGANYRATMGSRTLTLQQQDVQNDKKYQINASVNTSISPKLLWSFPSYSRLVHRQYDFSVRRAGRRRFSEDGLFVAFEPDMKSMTTESEQRSKLHVINDGVVRHGDAEPIVSPKLSTQQLPQAVAVAEGSDLSVEESRCMMESDKSLSLSQRHWDMVSDLLEVSLDVGGQDQDIVLHIEPAVDANYMSQLGLDATSANARGKTVVNILLSSSCADWKIRQPGSFWYEFSECLYLPNLSQSEASWEVLLNQLGHFSFQLVIVNEKIALQCLQERLSLIWNMLNGHDFPYLLLLGTCAGAPSGLTLTDPQHRVLNDDNSNSIFDAFVVLEDICTERMWVDAGAVLYHREDLSESNAGSTYAVMKRHQGDIISRRFRQAFTFLND